MPSKRPKIDYPAETEGSRIAAKLRKEASKMTAEERKSYFEEAMQMIYGTNGTAQVRKS